MVLFLIMPEIPVNHIVVGDIATNCWIYPLSHCESENTFQTPRGLEACALIDPGEQARHIIDRLQTLKMFPVYILLTHGHFDHIAALPEIAAAYNKPVVAIHSGDAHYLGNGAYEAHCESFAAAAGNSAYIDALWRDMPPPDLILEEGGSVGPFTVLHLPGHTQGSAALWDKKAKNLFSGDTLFRGDYGRTDLPGGNEAQLFESLRRLFALDGDINVFPGHGQTTTIGAEAARGMI